MKKTSGQINIFQAIYILLMIAGGIWFQHIFPAASWWEQILLFVVGAIIPILTLYILGLIIEFVYKRFVKKIK